MSGRKVAGLHAEIVPSRADGRQAGSPLVVLPGLMGDGRMLRRLTGRLARRRTVICVDPLGSGQSDVPTGEDRHGAYGWTAQADRLVQAIDELGVEPADLLGLSMGGVLAQHALLGHPTRFRHAILAVTSARPLQRERCMLQAMGAQACSDMDRTAFARSLVSLLFSPRFLSRPGAVALAESLLSELPPPRASMVDQIDALLAHDLEDELVAIHHVRAVIAGEHDWLMPPAICARLADALDTDDLADGPVVLPGCGHLPWIEAFDEFVEIIERALA